MRTRNFIGTICILFDLTWPEVEPLTYRTRTERSTTELSVAAYNAEGQEKVWGFY